MIQAVHLSKEVAQGNGRRVKLGAMEQTNNEHSSKSAFNSSTKKPERMTPAKVCFGSPVMSLSARVGRDEGHCSVETEVLTPDDAVSRLQEVPAKWGQVSIDQGPPPEKKMRQSEVYIGVSSSSGRSLQQGAPVHQPYDTVDPDDPSASDASAVILDSGSLNEREVTIMHNDPTDPTTDQEGSARMRNGGSPSLGSLSPNSEQKTGGERCQSNGTTDTENVQVVPGHSSKLSQDALSFTSSCVPQLGGTAFLEEVRK